MKTKWLLVVVPFLCAASMHARVNFVHVPKCAGSTMHALLVKWYRQKDQYPQRRMPDFSLQGFEDSVPINHKLVSGHFPLWFFERKDPTFDESFTFTTLRDPVERVLSHCRYLAQTNPTAKAADPVRHRPNWICRMLCSDPDLQGEELLENCKQNLDKFNLILFIDDKEEFDKGVYLLFKKLKLRYRNGRTPIFNTTVKKQVDERIINIVKKRNDLDIRLYEYARANYPLEKYL